MSSRRVFRPRMSIPTTTEAASLKAAPQETAAKATAEATPTRAPVDSGAVKAPAPVEAAPTKGQIDLAAESLAAVPAISVSLPAGSMKGTSSAAPTSQPPASHPLWATAQTKDVIEVACTFPEGEGPGSSTGTSGPSTSGPVTNPVNTAVLQPILGSFRDLDADAQGAVQSWQNLNGRIQGLPDPYRAQLTSELQAGMIANPILSFQTQIALLLRDGEDTATVARQSGTYLGGDHGLDARLTTFNPAPHATAAETHLTAVESSVGITGGGGSGGSGGSGLAGGGSGGGTATGLAVSDTQQATAVKSAKVAAPTSVSAAPTSLSAAPTKGAQPTAISLSEQPAQSGSSGGGSGQGGTADFNPPPGGGGGGAFDQGAFDALRQEIAAIRALIDLIRGDIQRARQAAVDFINDLTGLNIEVGSLGSNGPGGQGASNVAAALGNLQQLMAIAQDIMAKAQAAQDAVTNIQASVDALQTLMDELDAIQNDPNLGPVAKLQAMRDKIAEIRVAFDVLKAQIQDAVAAVRALVTAVQDGIQQAIALINQALLEIKAALTAFHNWLHQKVDAFEAFLADLRQRIDELTTFQFRKLSLRLKYIRCNDKQDPWTQDTGTGDKIHLAWITIDPSGAVTHGIQWLGRFHHEEGQGASDARVWRTPDFLVRRYNMDTWGTFNNTYVTYLALFEQDGNVDFDTKWANVAAAVDTDLRTRLSTLLNAEARGDVIDAYKDQLHQLIINSFWNWNEDDLLGVVRYSVRHLYPAQVFTPTPRAEMNQFFSAMAAAVPPPFWTYDHTTKSDAELRQKMADMRMNVTMENKDYLSNVFTNANLPHDPTVGEGEYSLQVCWELHN